MGIWPPTLKRKKRALEWGTPFYCGTLWGGALCVISRRGRRSGRSRTGSREGRTWGGSARLLCQLGPKAGETVSAGCESDRLQARNGGIAAEGSDAVSGGPEQRPETAGCEELNVAGEVLPPVPQESF